MKSSLIGLSIIEFIIVYIFVSIFLILAIPAIDEKLTQWHVAKALRLGEVAKAAVTKVTMRQNHLPKNQQETGFISPKNSDVAAVEIANDGSGIVTLTTTEKAGGGTIVFVPDFEPGKSVTWDCSEGTLDDKYRPPECY